MARFRKHGIGVRHPQRCQNTDRPALPSPEFSGGGIGNMFDRIGLGYVVDFIYFKIINFAKFNIADSCVCIGAGLIILALLRDIIREAKALRAERDTQ